MTMVSPMPSFLSCASGWMYSARMRMGRAGVLCRSWSLREELWGVLRLGAFAVWHEKFSE